MLRSLRGLLMFSALTASPDGRTPQSGRQFFRPPSREYGRSPSVAITSSVLHWLCIFLTEVDVTSISLFFLFVSEKRSHSALL